MASPSSLPLFSVICTVYKSATHLPAYLEAARQFARKNRELFALQWVFVVDGSPDDSVDILRARLPEITEFQSRLIELSRNFGAPYALRCALHHVSGDYVAPIPPDMQEPLDLVKTAFLEMHGKPVDICFGVRQSRLDPMVSKTFSNLFWWIYRKTIQHEIPKQGLDFFACTRVVAEAIGNLTESNSFFIGILFNMGFRRKYLPYHKRERQVGRSSWTLRKKLSYLFDSLFSFSLLPLRIVTAVGAFGSLIAVIMGALTIWSRLHGEIPIQGFSGTVISIYFFGGLNSVGIGIIGEYLWRTFQNSNRRPLYFIRRDDTYNSEGKAKREGRRAAG